MTTLGTRKRVSTSVVAYSRNTTASKNRLLTRGE